MLLPDLFPSISSVFMYFVSPSMKNYFLFDFMHTLSVYLFSIYRVCYSIKPLKSICSDLAMT